MQVLQGIAVSPGVAVGEALVIDNEGFRIPRRFVLRDAVEQEVQRLHRAIDSVAEEIDRNRLAVNEQLGEQYGAIFSAHIQVLRDPRLLSELEELIHDRHYSPEYAVSCTLRRYAKVFEQLPASYLAPRAHDLFDIEKSLLKDLLGRQREELNQLSTPVIVLAHNLTPSETARLDPKLVLGFVTEVGGLGGHTAIVAEAKGIPAVVGLGRFLTDVSGGDVVIVDGDLGKVVMDPDAESLEKYHRQEEQKRSYAASLEAFNALPAETADRVRVQVSANIEFPNEVYAGAERGAEGIGLYRTEFLYLGADHEPTEVDHFRAYSEVVQAMQGQPVVIRTLDLGADKMGQVPRDEEEENPFLGLRSIRLSLRNMSLFRVQLRAILRASALGDVQVMFPMIATLHELRQAKMVLADAMEDLEERGIEFRRDIPVGMMVEVPSAVVRIDQFLREVDFISIGTNDLVQYTLAVDRSNRDVADLYRSTDPSVLRLIRQSIQAANEANKHVSACGQMSSHPAEAMLLLGMGLRSLSVPPSAIPEIKQMCRAVSIDYCEKIAERAMSMEHAREIETYLQEELKRCVPELTG